MAEASVGSRDLDTRKSLSWTELLKTFLIALDPFKLLIAALGILLLIGLLTLVAALKPLLAGAT